MSMIRSTISNKLFAANIAVQHKVMVATITMEFLYLYSSDVHQLRV